MKKLPIFLALAAFLASCNDIGRDAAPPADRFAFPIGIGLAHFPATCATGGSCLPCTGGVGIGCRTVLYVASSNFDLSFDPRTGGTVVAVDPDASQGSSLARVGGPVRIGSFAGDMTMVDETSCTGWQTGTPPHAPVALVTSRLTDTLYAISLGASGEPGCGPGCEVPLDSTLGDPYSVAVACTTGAAGLEADAWVTYLRTPDNGGWLSTVPLHPAPRFGRSLTTSYAPANIATYHAARNRLYFTSRFVPSYTPLRFLDLGQLAVAPPPIQLQSQVWGAETTGLAISSDGMRAYVALRLFDGDLAARAGARPPDHGGAIAVLDIQETVIGGPAGTLLHLEPYLGRGPAQVRAIARAGKRDLVAVTTSIDSALTLYDDQLQRVVKVIGVDPGSAGTGAPLLGKQVYGLAVESPYLLSAAFPQAIRIFVSSFADGWVSVVQVDDPSKPEEARIVRQFGAGAP